MKLLARLSLTHTCQMIIINRQIISSTKKWMNWNELMISMAEIAIESRKKIENNLIGVRTNHKPINEYDLNKIGHFTFLSSVSQYFNGSHLSCIFDQAHFWTPNWANLIESKPQNVHWFDWMWNFWKNFDAVSKLSFIWSEFFHQKNIPKNRFKLSRCLVKW